MNSCPLAGCRGIRGGGLAARLPMGERPDGSSESILFRRLTTTLNLFTYRMDIRLTPRQPLDKVSYDKRVARNP